MSLFHINIGKAITRAVGLKDSAAPIINYGFLPFAATNLAVNAIGSVAGAIVKSDHAQTAPNIPEGAPGQNYIIQMPQTQTPYYQPVYSGSYMGSYDYGPQNYNYLSEGGYSPWGYSISQPTYSQAPIFQAPAVTYSQPSQATPGIWEDLAPLALAFL